MEILGQLFPEYFGLMAGIRNLIQSTCGFLAFVLLPMWADGASKAAPADWNSTVVLEDGTVDPEGNPFVDNDGTSFALWMTVALGVASTVSTQAIHRPCCAHAFHDHLDDRHGAMTSLS